VSYDNTNKGVLFKNDQGGNPKRPQYRGSLNVDGVEYNISAWIKEAKKDGSKFMSLSIEPKQARPQQAKPQVTEDFVDDELPPF
jgi:hypothetical protein